MKNRISGLTYAFTKDGIELPVLDITHPLFISSIDENNFSAIADEAAIHAEHLKKLPSFVKKLMKRLSNSKDSYLSGMRTLVFKLGPKLIGNNRKIEWWYRIGARQFSAMAVRLRLKKLCEFQSEILKPQLAQSQSKSLCFINIAGGSAVDSINALILIQKENPALLKNRKIEINVLDCDTFGPYFAEKSIEALKEQGNYFESLELSFRHIPFDWNHPETLTALLSERKDWIQIGSSEGGLFEYAVDETIIRNLNVLYHGSAPGMEITGTVFFNEDKVNPAIFAGMEIMGVKVRYIGMDGVKELLKKSGWILGNSADIGDVYSVFTLKKV